MTYINEDAKRNLITYKYQGCDGSKLTPYIEPFWNWSVQFVPKWMAPNMVTLIGFLAIIYHYLQTLYFYWKGSNPSWIYLVNAFCLFWYMTLDAIDGKHARNTKSSSPLGELFDHGCDAITTMLQTVCILYATKLVGTWIGMFVVVTIHTTFYFCIWEQYFTGMMRFSVITGPTEALLAAISVHLITFVSEYFDFKLWTYKISWLPGNFQLNYIVAFFSILTALPSWIENIQIIMRAKLTKEQKSKKGSALRSLFPFLWLNFWTFAWMLISPSNLHKTMAIPFYSYYGLLTAYMAVRSIHYINFLKQTRLVLARVINDSCSIFYWILAPLPLNVLNSLLGRLGYTMISETFVMTGFFIYIIVLYSHMVLSVINTICDFLGIYCLSLKKRVIKSE